MITAMEEREREIKSAADAVHGDWESCRVCSIWATTADTTEP